MTSSAPATDRHHLRFDSAYVLPAKLLGVRPETAWVEIGDELLTARFGRWSLATPIANIGGAGVVGPFSRLKTMGPPRLSLADRGLTFATNADLGACLRFDEPVTAIDPLGVIRHPGLTVTVADPERLVSALAERGVARTDIAQLRTVQTAVDDLRTMTASDLRALAKDRGVEHPASMKKADLVALLERDLDADLVEELADR